MTEQITKRTRVKAKKRFYVVATLPEKFDEILESIIAEELIRAQNTWGVRLSEEEKTRVIQSTHRQLESKVFSAMESEWVMGQRDISVWVRGEEIDATCYLPINDDSTYADMRVVRKRNFWEISHENTDAVVSLNDIPDQIIGLMKDWVRTGIYYGVGSYK